MISTHFRFQPSDDTAFDVCADPAPAPVPVPPPLRSGQTVPPAAARTAPHPVAPAPALPAAARTKG
jgi:hypothetical protein